MLAYSLVIRLDVEVNKERITGNEIKYNNYRDQHKCVVVIILDISNVKKLK